MSTYILILTLVFKSGYAGAGGVSVIRDIPIDTCHAIGTQWVKQQDEREGMISKDKSSYLCVPENKNAA